jgi:uncharacterized membrane protein YbhN (UPF0104 family)
MSEPSADTAKAHSKDESRGGPRWGVKEWVWFLAKNIIGWVLIILAWPIGIAIPGPGGLPLFLIGFALVTFPGKRHLTARVLRGIPVKRHSFAFRTTIAVIAIVLPAMVLIWLRYVTLADIFKVMDRRKLVQILLYICSVATIWILGLRADRPINWLLRHTPRARRKIRPWLRRKGLDLLPPRRRRRRHSTQPDDGILEIHQRHQDRVWRTWSFARIWGQRILGIAITVTIFYWMFKPVYLNWAAVKEPLSRMNWWYLALGAVMFAVFLFAFRVLSWWRILDKFGHRLPIAPATRIWSVSELARYLPGVIWQVVGRVFLIKPYGVSGSVCTTSQILELTIFLLANLLVALACLIWLGIKLEPQLRPHLLGALLLVPVLLIFLHPKVFYGIFDRVMRRLGKGVIELRLRKRELFGLGVWAIAGLLWQSLAIWVIVHGPLQLQFTKWWVVAGAYCLAWCAGFLAFWAPGGLGVREAVFMMAMAAALPSPVRHRFADHTVLNGFLAFLAGLLRLWVTSGELLLASLAYALDARRKGRVSACELDVPPDPNRTPAAKGV